MKCNRTSQDIDTFLIKKKLTPSQAILDFHKKIYLSLHLRYMYLDKIWFAIRLWPSETSDINIYETGSSIQPSRPPSWEMDMTSYFRSGCFDFEKISVAWCRVMCRFRANGRNRKYISNMADVCFSKNGSSYISASIYVDEIWFVHRLWPSEGSKINRCQTGNSIASIWTSYRFIKLAAAVAQYYFRFRICWYSCLQKVKVYEQTKFRRHISIDGWDITTSVFEKQTSAILEIYFRFRCRPFARNMHIILHQATEFFSKSKHPLRKWRHIHFSRWRKRRLNTTSGFVSVNVAAFKGQSLSANQIGVSFRIRLPNFVSHVVFALG